MTATPLLTAAQRRTLEAVCAALLPDGAPAHVPLLMEEVVAQSGSPEVQARFRRLLATLESPLANLALGAGPRGISALGAAERERFLLGWAQSRLAVKRQGFQALKRLALFLAYASPGDGAAPNPLWGRAGYEPPPLPAAAEPALRPREVRADLELEADVCVVGSGAGGGVVAGELSSRGRRVVVLEKGPWVPESELPLGELAGIRRLYEGGGMAASEDLGVTLLAGSCVGGGTAVNWMTCLRPEDELLVEWERGHGLEGLSGPAFRASLDAVERRLHVDDEESTPNADDDALLRGCRALGYDAVTLRRNSKGCQECGACAWGCRVGAKQSSARTFLADAARAGMELLAGCEAERLLIENGAVTGVEAWARDPSGGRHRVMVRAPQVAVAAGSLHSPALLRRSGLDNENIGRHLHLHPASAVVGWYDEPVRPWCGVPQAVGCREFLHPEGERGGILIESVPAHPGIMALGLPWQSRAEHAEAMRRADHAAVFVAIARDRASGWVKVDARGRPVVRYRVEAEDRARVKRGEEECARIHWAAGAQAVTSLHQSPARIERGDGKVSFEQFRRQLARLPAGPNQLNYYSAHQMGSCRMGANPRWAVADPFGQVFGVRGLYVADASSFPSAVGVNPMITVMAMAHRTARAMAAQQGR